MADLLRTSELWPPVRAKSLDVGADTFALLESVGVVRRTDVSGAFALMPLGLRIRDRMETIIRSSFQQQGFSPLWFPSLHSRKIWEQSGRWRVYADNGSLFRVAGRRSGEELCLAPTSEEIAVATVAMDLRSYRDLPARLYLSTTKFRDEVSPRGGLVRSREFEMADAYTFDSTEDGMLDSVGRLNEACATALRRIGFTEVLPTQADGGDISQEPSTEHVVVTDIGQSEFLACPVCGLRGDPAVVTADFSGSSLAASEDPIAARTAKVIAFRCTGEERPALVCVVIRGDLRASERKILAATRFTGATMLDEDELRAEFDRAPHMLNPVDAVRRSDVVLFDHSVAGLRDFTVADRDEPGGLRHGANWGEPELLTGIEPVEPADVHVAAPGTRCGRCREGWLTAHRAVELGHVFQLGARYSAAMGLSHLDQDGRPSSPLMACSGIGIGRCLQALAHVLRDERGLVWPRSVSPADFHLVPLRSRDGAEHAGRLAAELARAGRTVLLDDRPVSAGEKFRYAWALGVPHHVVVVGDDEPGRLELVCRRTGEQSEVTAAEIVVGAAAACCEEAVVPSGL